MRLGWRVQCCGRLGLNASNAPPASCNLTYRSRRSFPLQSIGIISRMDFHWCTGAQRALDLEVGVPGGPCYRCYQADSLTPSVLRGRCVAPETPVRYCLNYRNVNHVIRLWFWMRVRYRIGTLSPHRSAHFVQLSKPERFTASGPHLESLQRRRRDPTNWSYGQNMEISWAFGPDIGRVLASNDNLRYLRRCHPWMSIPSSETLHG
jgi:hypothetical protein